MAEYRIPAVNFPRLQEEIEKLNKRATKLNMEPVKLAIVKTETVTRKDELLGFEYQETYHFCTVEGETPHLAGWRLIAAVEPVGDERLIREVPGRECPVQYRTTDFHCDQCHTTRQRKAIFVLQNEDTQEYKQVGSTCIADFLGGASPEGLLGSAEYVFNFVSLAGEAQEEGWGGGGKRAVPIQHFVRVVSIIHRRLGYVSRTAAREGMSQATADLAWSLCTSPSADWRKFVEDNNLFPEEVDLRVADTALEWAAAITPQLAKSNYLHDLGVCCRQDHVTSDRAGYVSSVIQAYNFNLEKQAKPSTNSIHLGEVGKRREFTLTIVSLNSSDGQWGAVTKVTFKDEANNAVIWWASGCPAWLVTGETVKVIATVKKHGEYRGVKQTELKIVKPVETKDGST